MNHPKKGSFQTQIKGVSLIYNGNENHTYKQALGFLNTGEHSLQFYFDYNNISL